jgi:hypothetical protein
MPETAYRGTQFSRSVAHELLEIVIAQCASLLEEVTHFRIGQTFEFHDASVWLPGEAGSRSVMHELADGFLDTVRELSSGVLDPVLDAVNEAREGVSLIHVLLGVFTLCLAHLDGIQQPGALAVFRQTCSTRCHLMSPLSRIRIATVSEISR